jgi:hypothetical protein
MRAALIVINHRVASALVAMICLFIPFVAIAQDAASSPSSSDYVSRAEYEKLKAEHEAMKSEHEAMKSELDALKTAVRQMAVGMIPAPPAEGPRPAKKPIEGKQVVATTTSPAATDELRAEVETLKAKVNETFPGTTKFLLAGYGTAGFTAPSGGDPFFDAAFNAIFLWKFTDRLFFEGELEFEFEDGATTTNLEIAQTSYLLNDYMTIGVGRFLDPMDFFVERQHMNWVNKLPDKPLAVYDGLLPESELGAQLRGVVPIGPTKLEYVAFVANAPDLITMPGDDFSTLGMLDFDNLANSGGHVSVGGHVGFIPIPQFEIGYGIQGSKTGPSNQEVDNILQSVDLNYVQDSTFLKGLINFRAQWVWSHVGSLVYDADGAQGFGPYEFDNNRDGGYVQLSYRPTRIDNDIIKNVEAIARYDRLNQLHTPVGFDEQRLAFGLDYWLTPSAVVKAAYEIDNKNGVGEDQNAFMLQVAVGF